MSWRTGVCVSCVAAFLLLLGSPAIAPAKALSPVTGKLSKPDYTVIAIAANGKARSAQAGRGKFKLRPPGAVVTLHLRAPDGSYAGPIVVGREMKGRRAILGVKAGAKLGRVDLRLGKGYAKVKDKLAGKWVDATREARAKNGVPIGAGKDGLVRSKNAKGGAPGDSDLDGIPDSLDIDDDGDLILDDYDRSTHRGASRSASQSDVVGLPFLDGSFLDITTALGGGITDSVNVNGGSSDEQIAAAEQSSGTFGALWTGIDPGSGELDCGTLVYCSAGGTGRFVEGPTSQRDTAPPFPECCDPDGDGLGSFTETNFGGGGGGVHHMSLFHGATADQIRAGDVLIERGTVHGATAQFASTVGFVYSTMPALASYSDGQGNSSSFSYPRMLCFLAGGVPGPTSTCPAPVRSGPNGDVVVTMTFWRPQRRRVEREPGGGKWMDVGNLAYGETVTSVGLGAPGGFCPQSSYTGVDPNLTLLPPTRSSANPPVLNGARFGDLAGDRPSNPANTFTFTLNLTDCLASKGLSMNAMQPVVANLTALSENDDGGPIFMATSTFNFILQP